MYIIISLDLLCVRCVHVTNTASVATLDCMRCVHGMN